MQDACHLGLVPTSDITIIIIVIRGVYVAYVAVGTLKNIIIKMLRIDIIIIIRKRSVIFL